MKRGLVQSSRYSPGNMDSDSLETLFVGRHKTLDKTLDKIRLSATTAQKHFTLLVGPRGSGKTHFVSLAYHRLKAEHKITPQLVIALLNEEEWGVASYLDFLVRILQSLSGELTKSIDSKIADIYTTFSANPVEAQALAEKLLTDGLNGKTLLLICENLDDLFNGLGDEGQKRWRSFIQQSGFWTILASTPALFSEISQQDCPFYGFFNIRYLKKLDFDTALDLLIKKSGHENKPELAKFIRTPIGRARVRAIHHLAGGNHRVYVVLFDFLDKESLNDLVDPFMRMVDDMTPYYQDRMRQLSPTKRKIVEFLCKHAKPTAIKDIATPCLMTHQTATKQIGELVAGGFISKSKIGRNTYCELTEPLMRICIEVKDNRTEHLSLFVEFLRHWYSNRELKKRLSRLPHTDTRNEIDRAHVTEAMRCYENDQDEPFIDALHEESARCIVEQDFKGLAGIQAKIVEDTDDPSHYLVPIVTLRQSGKFELAMKVGRAIASVANDDPDVHFELASTYWGLDEMEKALREIDHALEIHPESCPYKCMRGSILIELERFSEGLDNELELLDMDPSHYHSYSQIIRCLTDLGRAEEAIEYSDKLVETSPDDADSLVDAGYPFFTLEQFDRALELINKAIEIDADNDRALNAKATVFFKSEDYEAASKELRVLAKKTPNSVSVLYRLSDCLLFIEEYEEAISVAKKLLKADSEHFHAYFVICYSYFQLDQEEKALRILKKVIKSENPSTLASASEVFIEHDWIDEANKFLDRAFELDSENADAWLAKSLLRTTTENYESGKNSANEAKIHGATNLQYEVSSSKALSGLVPLQEAINGLLCELATNDEIDVNDFADDLAEAIHISSIEFGPLHISSAFKLILNILPDEKSSDFIASILTEVLAMDLEKISGPAAEWAPVLEELNILLEHIDVCKIPIQMITAAILFLKTGDRLNLLSLPKELRTLMDHIIGDLEDNSKTLH
ncbi:MAG: tetratricopeptide repeat protein [Gammaproteobacteria bacterium]|nr:tetratricopeptide repeat protein [Gammaproteobacteria bacterium]